jgi:hypothetical protein
MNMRSALEDDISRLGTCNCLPILRDLLPEKEVTCLI